jgi:hypothetical protein
MAVGKAVEGATSLVELILKKFADDTAGAAKELERLGGFPESVSQRIASGELPMDEASRVARREDRYADEGLVHVNRGGIKGEGFDNSRLPTDDPDTPFNAHWFTTDPHPSTAFRGQGSDEPFTYTPAVLEKGRRGDWRDVVEFGESPDGIDAGYGTEFREGLLGKGVSDLVVRGGDKIDQSTIDALPVDGRLKVDPDNKYGDRRNSLVKNDDGSLGYHEGSEHILDYDDLADYQRFNPEIRDVAVLDNTIIRSPNAAFDPQYKGSNIMGGAAGTAGLAGLLAAGQSEDSEAGPLTAAAKALLDRNFTESAVSSATDMANAYKSREALTLMDIDEFLNLAQKGYAPDKFDALKGVEKFDEVPFLSIDYRDGADGVAHVTGHEGRHRAMTLRDRGETQIPVRMRGNIRWDQQETPNFDYVEDWPSLLASENEGITSPFPFKRGDRNLLDSSEMALRSKYTPPKKPEPKPDSYDTEILAELLDEFNFEKGNADPRLLGGTAAGTAGLLALGASDDADAGVAGRVLSESGLAYKQLRKQVARNRQNGISPGNTVKQWVHDKKNTTYNDMNSYAAKVDGGKGGDYYKQQTQNIVDQILEGVENPDKDLVAGLAEWNGARQSRELGHRPDWEKGAASPGLLGGTAAVTAGALATPALMKDEPFDPTAPLPAPDFATQMGKAGEVLGTVLDAPMTGLQGIARGLFGLIEGEDLVTAGAEANHMMKGGSEEGFDRVGDKVEGLFAPIDKQFPYLNVGKSAGDATSLLMSLFSPI